MTRVLFVEGKDADALRAFSRTLPGRWRLLARPKQGLFLLEATDAGEEAERAAAALPGARAWSFDVLDEGPGG
jgi:hypothetical protein